MAALFRDTSARLDSSPVRPVGLVFDRILRAERSWGARARKPRWRTRGCVHGTVQAPRRPVPVTMRVLPSAAKVPGACRMRRSAACRADCEAARLTGGRGPATPGCPRRAHSIAAQPSKLALVTRMGSPTQRRPAHMSCGRRGALVGRVGTLVRGTFPRDGCRHVEVDVHTGLRAECARSARGEDDATRLRGGRRPPLPPPRRLPWRQAVGRRRHGGPVPESSLPAPGPSRAVVATGTRSLPSRLSVRSHRMTRRSP